MVIKSIMGAVCTLLTVASSNVNAAVVSGPATASGGFGSQGNPGSTAFILGQAFAGSGEMITISAGGTINLSAGAANICELESTLSNGRMQILEK